MKCAPCTAVLSSRQPKGKRALLVAHSCTAWCEALCMSGIMMYWSLSASKVTHGEESEWSAVSAAPKCVHVRPRSGDEATPISPLPLSRFLSW